eukprot:scaffold1183_cov418-Prasinococcus_capsulatus_cf.AAC.34
MGKELVAQTFSLTCTLDKASYVDELDCGRATLPAGQPPHTANSGATVGRAVLKTRAFTCTQDAPTATKTGSAGGNGQVPCALNQHLCKKSPAHAQEGRHCGEHACADGGSQPQASRTRGLCVVGLHAQGRSLAYSAAARRGREVSRRPSGRTTADPSGRTTGRRATNATLWTPAPPDAAADDGCDEMPLSLRLQTLAQPLKVDHGLTDPGSRGWGQEAR